MNHALVNLADSMEGEHCQIRWHVHVRAPRSVRWARSILLFSRAQSQTLEPLVKTPDPFARRLKIGLWRVRESREPNGGEDRL